MAKVAVVGLGAMGSRIARRLLDSGHELVVWNRDPARTAPLTAAGAVAAESPGEAAGQAEAVITMVSNPDALRDVTEGPAGVGEGLIRPTTLIQMSTVGTAATARLAAALPDDAGLLDAPVLGSMAEAEGGTLKIYAGGEEPLVERWTPLLSTLGSVIHVGPVGAGSAAKLVAKRGPGRCDRRPGRSARGGPRAEPSARGCFRGPRDDGAGGPSDAAPTLGRERRVSHTLRPFPCP